MNNRKTLKANSKNVEQALRVLESGNIIIYPTDTLYGFGVDASNEKAINKLNKLKNRIQPLSILLSSVDEINKYGEIDDVVIKKISGLLPGPYTLLISSKRNHNISDLVQGESHLIGLRVINMDFCNDLISKLGKPIVTTSVNKHGTPPITNIEEIQKIFPSIPIFYNKKNLISNGSTIIDFSQTPEKVIRMGEGKYQI